jgi:hypothetical protein
MRQRLTLLLTYVVTHAKRGRTRPLDALWHIAPADPHGRASVGRRSNGRASVGLHAPARPSRPATARPP